MALAYQALIPLWERTKRFKNIYACLAIDGLFAIFWASAFGSVQAWTASGIPSNSTGYCKGFTYGDDDRCTISFGTVILGVLIFIMFLIAAGISGYKVWYFRKNGYCISQRPSISNPKPVEPKFVYGDSSSSVHSTRSSDLEKGGLTISVDGTHPGRKLSWDAAPLTAPACAPDFPEAKPTFRQIDYNNNNPYKPTENTRLTQYEPYSRRPVPPSRHIAPPKLQLYGPGDRTPALVMDYGATTPYGPQEPYAPSLRYSHRPYTVSPSQPQYRTSMAQAPATARYNNNNPNYNTNAGSHESFIGGYRPNYASGIPNGGYDTYNRRGSAMRMAIPGPASTHAGGYQSAYHTPLPSAMMNTGGGNYHAFKRESTVQFYSQQQAFAGNNYYGR